MQNSFAFSFVILKNSKINMKKILRSLIAVALISFQSKAQTTTTAPVDTSWKMGGIFNVNFNQSSFSQWAGGGENSIALSSLFVGFANYKKEKWAWDNSLLLAYGLTKTGSQDLRKNDDRLEFTTKPGYEFKKNWFISYLFNFRSQFDKGYDYTNEPKILVSEFLAPAYLINSLGIEYKPNDNFYFYVSPPTIKTTLVNASNSIIPHLAYGVDSTSNVKNEIGFYLSTRYKKDIAKNISLATKLDLFSNYTDNPQNIDVNWDFIITMKVNSHITTTLGFQAIYDDNIFVPKGNDAAGLPRYGKGLQFKESLGVGLTYNMGAAKK